MPNVAAEQSLEALFTRPPEELTRLGWERRELKGGEMLWEVDAPAREMAWIIKGELSVQRDADELGRAKAGELIGEASALIEGERRHASVQATAPCSMWVLSRAHLSTMRATAPDVYDRVLLAALDTMARRIEETDREIAFRSGWQFDALRAPVEAAQWPVAEEVALPEPVDTAALRALPGAELWTDSVFAALERIALPRTISAGSALCIEGSPASSMYVLASGQLRVFRFKEGGDAVELAVVAPGHLLGTNALFTERPRGASLVAAETCQLLELRREDLETLPPGARRALSESLLMAQRAQLAHANDAALRSRGSRAAITMEDAIQGLARLNSWRVEGPAFSVALSSLPPVDPVQPPAGKQPLFDLIRESIIGRDVTLPTPFGHKRVVYADYTASGRCLSFIEDYLRDRVMPLYANTHSEASASGLQTMHFREEARGLVGKSVGATEDDAVIFVGAGATGAINKLIGILNIAIPADLDARYHLSDRIPAEERPVVFIGPYEHHSNILPWKHSLADVEIVPLDKDGGIDMDALEGFLVEYRDRPLRIGSFSAASNVTGVRSEPNAVTTLLHKHGALAFWDYAGAGPYVEIDMNPEGENIDAELARKDAVFLSPHKFIGGPGTPGLLIVKREIVKNTVPTQPGGGTVDFVTWMESLYADDIEVREEGGTPAIIESIRCGLVFQLKDQVGADAIEHMEAAYARRAIEAWRANPAVRIVGNPDADRLSITSFLIHYGDAFVHHGFVVALLNDLFGVQARGGCSCAGPYGAMLLGLSPTTGQMFLDRAEEGWLSLKPGWSRVNFNYFIGDTELQYIIDAVHMVAVYGWALMPHYKFNPRNGLWSHREGNPYTPASLTELSVAGGKATWPKAGDGMPDAVLRLQLEDGRRVLERALVEPPPDVEPVEVPAEFEAARWFPLSHEIAEHLRARQAEGREEHTDPDALRRTAYQRALEQAKRGTASALDSIRRAFRISPEEQAELSRQEER